MRFPSPRRRALPWMLMCLMAAVAALTLLPAQPRAGEAKPAAETSAPSGEVRRYLYAGLDGYVAVYDIDDGHKLVKTLDVGNGKKEPGEVEGVHGAGVFRGICADAASGRLYLAYNPTDELICFDLLSEQVLWRKSYGKHADSQAITPDGKVIYLPCREAGYWSVIDAGTGEQITTVVTEGAPHNTRCSDDGDCMYLETLSHPFVFVADAKSHQLAGKIGPFGDVVRPFSLSADEKYVFACVNNLLGFEVGDVARRKMIYRVEAKTPEERVKQVPNPTLPHGCPSHGVGLRPDQREVWVVNGSYGYLHVYDVTGLPDNAPKHVADVPLFEKPDDRPEPGWVCFSLDGKYAYAPGNAVVDTDTKKVVARIATSEKMIEIDFGPDGKPVKAAPRMW